MDFQTFDLGRILQTASGLKADQRAAQDDVLRQQYMGGQIAGQQQEQSQSAANFQQQQQELAAKRQYFTAQAALSSPDPKGTIASIAPNFVQDYDAHHGAGSWDQLTPDQAHQAAQGVMQQALSVIGPQTKIKWIDNGGQQIAIDEVTGQPLQNVKPIAMTPKPDTVYTQGQENARAAAGRADRKPQLVDVPQPDGTVQKQWVTPGDTAGTNVGTATTPTTGMGMGRIQQMVGRITLAGNEVSRSAENLMEMNIGANSGILGIGKDQGHGILNSMKSALANTMSSDDTKSYNIKVAGVTRNLAAIEAAGNMPPGSLTNQMAAVVAQPGDTQINRLERMAEIRQIADAGLESVITQPGISQKQIDQIQGIRARIGSAIPFTQHDVEMLKQSKDPNTTLAAIAKQNGLGGGSGSPAPVVVKSDADYAKLPSGSVFVGPDGQQRRKP